VSEPVKVFTIGFTKKSAEKFFTRLQQAGVLRVLDTRLHNNSQLAGFSKRDDLRYFLRSIAGIDYVQVPELAPTAAILDAYKKDKGDWSVYETAFLALLAERHIETVVPRELIAGGCLLCSEDAPDHCHRRLVAEYLQRHWGDVEIVHIR
jgi:uncharacterized protein (DUF488 family)